MNTKIRKITALTLAILTVGAFTSCGEDKPEDIRDSQESESENQEANTEPEVKDINVAVNYKYDIMSQAAARYNNSHDDSRIQILNYSRYNTEDNPTGAAEQLRLDIISGEIPDIIDVSMIDGLGLEKFGMYTDLYPYLDADEELNRDSFIPSILELNEKDGKLYSMPVTCNTFYVYAGKSKFLSDYSDWETEDIVGINKQYPDKLLYGHCSNSADILFQTFDINDFIDYDTYTCNFDSEEFIDILEFCSQYPVEGEYNTATTENIRNDRALVGMLKLLSIDEIPQEFNEMFGDEEYTLIKTAYNFGSRFAVTENCWNKDYAWDYIKEFYNQEAFIKNLDNSEMIEAIPLTKPQFDAQVEYLQSIDDSSDNIFNKPVTDEEADMIYEILCNGKECVQNDNFDIYLICYEETQRCFNGDISPKECAEMIQSRVGIYLGEKA
ncbi:MAG: extracellular solute-binding protein [Ruminococcus sp.]|nr:extracellular solute-binding protein [Ruminococcus sp.]